MKTFLSLLLLSGLSFDVIAAKAPRCDATQQIQGICDRALVETFDRVHRQSHVSGAFSVTIQFQKECQTGFALEGYIQTAGYYGEVVYSCSACVNELRLDPRGQIADLELEEFIDCDQSGDGD